ncbi:unnamed protein product [Dimorphilus gyrociliatus]|uniref:Uncharacterized protein n=1 Tax=Dimorphilus gyrociliatus TaxID=2664684 RepID=A0A7I8WDG1_9ANNE|nr:unnamed protein product [Dimorphilus gyrociliatus]
MGLKQSKRPEKNMIFVRNNESDKKRRLSCESSSGASPTAKRSRGGCQPVEKQTNLSTTSAFEQPTKNALFGLFYNNLQATNEQPAPADSSNETFTGPSNLGFSHGVDTSKKNNPPSIRQKLMRLKSSRK